MVGRGSPPLSHFLRVRGTVDSGSYNRGFQTRQLTVDSILDVKETPQSCVTYEDRPQIWDAMGKVKVRGAAFSHDWKYMAIVDDDGNLGIWSVGPGELIKSLGPVEKVEPEILYKVPMVFSADDRRLFVGSNDGMVRVFSPLDGLLLYTLSHEDSTPGYNDIGRKWMLAITSISLNKSETQLAVMSNWVTRIWSLQTRQPVAEYNPRMGALSKAFFADDGSLLVISDTGTVTSYKMPGGPAQWSKKTGARNSQYMTRSPNGEWIAINASGDSIFLWSVAEEMRGPVLSIPSGFGGDGAMAFSPDGKMIVTSGGMYGLYVWDVRSGKPIRSFHGFPAPVSYAWFTPDGKSIVTNPLFNDGFRIVHLDSGNYTHPVIKADSTAMTMSLPVNEPRTVSGVVKAPNDRAVPGAEVLLMNGDGPDSVLQRTTTSSGGYFSFDGVRFPHVLVRVHMPGFQDGVMYIHQRRFYLGPGAIELKPLP